METQTRPKIGEIVKKANRSEIHRRTGISLSGVSRILSGKRNGKSANLKAIALQLGVSMDDLYTYATELRRKRSRSTKRRSQSAAA